MSKTNCPNCGGALPMCRCQIDGLTTRAQAIVSHERWLSCSWCHGKGCARCKPVPVVFVGIRKTVMQGEKCVGVMCSKTMAKRTANALNRHKPNREGV